MIRTESGAPNGARNALSRESCLLTAVCSGYLFIISNILSLNHRCKLAHKEVVLSRMLHTYPSSLRSLTSLAMFHFELPSCSTKTYGLLKQHTIDCVARVATFAKSEREAREPLRQATCGGSCRSARSLRQRPGACDWVISMLPLVYPILRDGDEARSRYCRVMPAFTGHCSTSVQPCVLSHTAFGTWDLPSSALHTHRE